MSVFVATNRRKKLKKLYVLSKSLIREFGFSYFLRIAFIELRKQGFALFNSDSIQHITQQSSFATSYNSFLENYGQKLKKLSEKSGSLESNPKFVIVFFFTKDQVEYFEKSLGFIVSQFYDCWKVFFITFDLDTNDKLKKLIDSYDLEKAYKDKITIKEFDNSYHELFKGSSSDDYISILEPGVEVRPDALLRLAIFLNQNTDDFDIVYTDSDMVDQTTGIRHNPFFKPDWDELLFYSTNYLAPLCFIKKKTIDKLEIKNIPYYCLPFALVLKSIEYTDKILHIPFPHASVSKTSKSHLKSVKVLQNHFQRVGIKADIKGETLSGTLDYRFLLDQEPKVSIIIPTKDNVEILKRCLSRIKRRTNYKNWEIIIIDNNSNNPETLSYYEKLDYKIIKYLEPFNFSIMNNLAVKQAKGEYLLFLNDDTAPINKEWLAEMVSVSLQSKVGAVGAMLLYEDGTIQHAGIAFLKTGSGFHPFQRQDPTRINYHRIHACMRNCSAVTGACLLVNKNVFEKVGGFDEAFDLYYGDSDLCLKIRDTGYKVVYTPHAKLLHEGSKSIRKNSDAFFAVENHYHFIKKWPALRRSDPFYNPNLDWDYSIVNTDKPTQDTL